MQKNRMLIALMEVYQNSILTFTTMLQKIDQEHFTQIKDLDTQDPDCKSIQTILLHIVRSGYTYANYIRQLHGAEWRDYAGNIHTIPEAIYEVEKMLQYTYDAIEPISTQSNSDLDKYVIEARWGVTYDIEQLLEHAIVHILRHHRQIENFMR